MHTHTPARRNFLKLSTRLADPGPDRPRLRAEPIVVRRRRVRPPRFTDYKALVCIYLFGGNDCNNIIVPVDYARNTPPTRRCAPA